MKTIKDIYAIINIVAAGLSGLLFLTALIMPDHSPKYAALISFCSCIFFGGLFLALIIDEDD
jgi:hypothetical protein